MSSRSDKASIHRGNERHKTGLWGADRNARKVEPQQNKTKRHVCKDAKEADACRKRVEKVYVGERRRHGRRSEKREAIV